MSRPIIEVEALSKRYKLGVIGATSLRDALSSWWQRRHENRPTGVSKDFWALRDVSFTVKPGEVTAIIGRNGAGKSTLLKILSRITEPTSGRAVLRGRVASLLEVGTGFHPDLTGRENVFLNGAILGMTRAEIRSRFDEIVAFAEMEKFIDTPVKRYSSGMHVRLAFAVAAHLEPEILIVDEVLAVGDAAFQKRCLSKMDDVAGRGGRTILFVSHNMLAVKSLCRRAILLAAGSIVAEGDSEEMVKRYLSSAEHARWQIEWPGPAEAPGNGQVWLRRVQVIPEKGADVLHVPLTAPLQVVVEYWNSAPGARLNVSLVLYTADEICVLNSTSEAAPRAQGMHRAVCHVPGGLLNAETYSVRILLVQDTSRVLLDRNRLVTFELHDVARDGHWFGKWEGVVRPALPWSAKFLGSQPAASDP